MATAIELKGDLDLAGAPAERQRVLDALDRAPPGQLDIEMVGSRTTQPALQILFATACEAQERGLEVTFGSRAAAELARTASKTL